MRYTVVTEEVKRMTPEQMQAIVEANTIAIAQINQALNTIVSEFIRPTTQQAVANFERLERIEGVVEASVQQIAANAEEISNLGRAVQANADQLADTRQLVAANAEANAQGLRRLDKLEELSRERGVQIDILIAEGRADRQNAIADRQSNERRFSEALSAIITNSQRLTVVEQQAS